MEKNSIYIARNHNWGNHFTSNYRELGWVELLEKALMNLAHGVQAHISKLQWEQQTEA